MPVPNGDIFAEDLQINNKVKNNRDGYFEDVVISGLSGRYPQSDNVDEFTKNLFAGVDMISESNERWPIGKFFKLKLKSFV